MTAAVEQRATVRQLFDELRMAAAGDRATLSTLARRAADTMLSDPRQASSWMTQAVTYARLAAISGTAADMRLLAGYLFVQAQMLIDQSGISAAIDDCEGVAFYGQQSSEAQAEALYWLNLAADLGDAVAEEMIVSTASLLDASVLALASAVTSNAKETAGV